MNKKEFLKRKEKENIWKSTDIRDKEKFPDGSIKYDYSLVPEKFSTEDKITLICPIHGSFEVRAQNHLGKNTGCKKCGFINSSGKKKFSNEEYIRYAKEVHSKIRKYYNLPMYDYSLTNYTGQNNEIDIICPIHGKFSKVAKRHLNGVGCPKCITKAVHDRQLLSKDEWIKRAKEAHKNLDGTPKYDYSLVEYKGQNYDVIINCKKHGPFSQQAMSHILGAGCPNCFHESNISKAETELQNFLSKYYNISTNDRKLLQNNKEIDIVIPDLKLCFEYDGMHFHNINRKPKYYHLNKTIEIESQNYQLIHIIESEFQSKKEIVFQKILTEYFNISKFKLNIDTLEIREVDYSIAKNFINKNDLFDFKNSDLFFGLYWESKNNGKLLVQILAIKNNQSNYEITNYCAIPGLTIKDGYLKLFEYFVSNYNPIQIIGYADKRWYTIKNNIFNKLGFNYIETTEPEYIKYYNEIVEDCGQLKYIWNKS